MSKDDFITAHGEDVWDTLVKPLQKKENPQHVRNNANAIVHYDVIGKVLNLLGIDEISLLAAKKTINTIVLAAMPVFLFRNKSKQ